jgi:hypothetical protein
VLCSSILRTPIIPLMARVQRPFGINQVANYHAEISDRGDAHFICDGCGMAEHTFYVIYDKEMEGCTIVKTEPTNKERHKIEGKYQSESEL